LEVLLHATGGARFVAESRHHRVVLDQPAEDGATDHGMAPAELLLSALGGCVGQYVAQSLSLRGVSSKGLRIRVTAEPSPRPLRLQNFRVEVVAPGLNARQMRALEKSFPAGLVQNALSLENALTITVVAEKPTRRKR